MKVDLHVHTRYSRDAVSSPKAILRMARRRGIDALAITDHDTTAGWREMVEGAEEADIGVILGEERKVFRNGRIMGELICLFLSKPVESRDVSEVVREVQDQGGIVCAAHPFDHRRVSFKETGVLAEQDIAIELFNARAYHPRGNRMALAFAEEHGSMITAGSDAHTPFEVGNAYIEADVQTLDELKEALIQRKVRAIGRRSNPLFSCYSFIGRWGYVC